MSSAALLLVLTSAAVHAYWNYLYKQAKDKQAFPVYKSIASWIMLTIAGTIAWRLQPPESLEFIPHAVLSGFCYAGYFIFMSAAYEHGDLSVVYPISRGVGPALAAVGGFVILHEKLTGMGVVGVGLILSAVVVISAAAGRGVKTEDADPLLGALFACLVGLMIAVYGVNDAVGVRKAHPLIFLMVGVGVSLLVLIPWQIWRHGRRRIARAWHQEWRMYLSCSVLDTSSYVLYLLALQLAPTAYVTPTRSVSVILAAVAGVALLKEAQGVLRIGSAAAVVAGVLLIRGWG
ncbi:MAG: EamA family transporter [Armatimonadia bacterium]|nr:EamA family transporter [Armatimonadia bacterium]